MNRRNRSVRAALPAASVARSPARKRFGRAQRGFVAGMGALLLAGAVWAADQPQWGECDSRNMVSTEKGLPESFDPATGRNVKWTARLGSETHASPIIARGRVFIGTNNDSPRDPKHEGDRGVLLCLDEADGRFVWQLVVPKYGSDPYTDWPRGGIVAGPTVEATCLYVMSNRGEMLCLDLAGQANGNDGPFRDEATFMTPAEQPPITLGPSDADILWAFNVHAVVGSYPHDAAHATALVHGNHLYLNTCNGVDNTHRKIRSPNAPSLIVLDKRTGQLLAQDAEHIGPRIFHSTWSSPSLGAVNGRTRVFFGGGDGVVYAFETLPPDAAKAPAPALAAPKGSEPAGEVPLLKKVWWFDCDPTGPKTNVHRYTSNRRESPSNIKSMTVFHQGRVYVTVGGDVWWGKTQAWLKCIDAAGTGDITQTGERWSYPLEKHCMPTPAIADGLVFIGDSGGKLHCVDAQTGQAVWVHDTGGEIWASALVADGKVYLGNRNGRFLILAAAREKKVLSSVELGDAINATATAANGVVYVTTMRTLFALKR